MLELIPIDLRQPELQTCCLKLTVYVEKAPRCKEPFGLPVRDPQQYGQEGQNPGASVSAVATTALLSAAAPPENKALRVHPLVGEARGIGLIGALRLRVTVNLMRPLGSP